MKIAKEVPNDNPSLIPPEIDYSKSKCKRMEGILFKLLSIVFFALMQILAKSLYIHSSISSVELLYFRGIIMVIIYLSYAKYLSVEPFVIPKAQVTPMLYRSLSGLIGNMLLFTSTQLLPLSLITALSYLAPMITAVMSFMFLHESLTIFDISAMIIAFVGVLIIVFNPYKGSDSSGFGEIKWWYYIFPLLDPVFQSICTILMRYLGESIHCIVAPTFLAVTIGSFTPILAFIVIFIRQHITEYNGMVIAYLIGIGLMGAGGQICVSRSLQVEKAGRIQTFNYLTIVFMIMADIIIFDVPIQWLDFAGIGIILAANLSVASLKGCGLIK